MRRHVKVETDGEERDCCRNRPDQPNRDRNRLPSYPLGVLKRVLDVDVPEEKLRLG